VRHAPERVADELAELAGQHASGALVISGDPGGTIYLSDGCLTFAESAEAPDLGTRLVKSGRLTQNQWSQASADSEADGGEGDLLLSRGLINAGEWELLLRSAALDALLALADDQGTAGTCFVSRQALAEGPVLRLAAGPTWEYAWQEAGRLAARDIVPRTRLRLCGSAGASFGESGFRGPAGSGFGPAARGLLGQFDGRTTLRDLAWRNGLALYAVMDWATRLIDDDVCIIGRPPGYDTPGPGQAPADAGSRWMPPDLGVLQQVLAGLRRLT